MSTKRILIIAGFGALIIAVAVALMLLTPYLRSDSGTVLLPEASAASENPTESETGAVDRVVVTRETVQAVVSSLTRQDKYSRHVVIESFWEGGSSADNIDVAVRDGLAALRVFSSVGNEKRIIVTPDKLYIWYRGDRYPYIGELDSAGDGYRTADEYQMLSTYEDILRLDRNYIIEADYTVFDDEFCIYVVYLSPNFGYTVKHYISVDLGLVIAAEEYDDSGMLIYRMTAGECITGEADPSMFILPDGTSLLPGE